MGWFAVNWYKKIIDPVCHIKETIRSTFYSQMDILIIIAEQSAILVVWWEKHLLI